MFKQHRISEADLKRLCDDINAAAGLPINAWIRNPATEQFAPVANVYFISAAYGGFNLHQMSDKPGCTGHYCPMGSGYYPKRELYQRMQAYLSGMAAINKGQS